LTSLALGRRWSFADRPTTMRGTTIDKRDAAALLKASAGG
jgi:hypothetical protein